MLRVALRPITDRVARSDATSASHQWSSWTSARHDGSFGRSSESTRDRRVNAPWTSSSASSASSSSPWQSQETQFSEFSFRWSGRLKSTIRFYSLSCTFYLSREASVSTNRVRAPGLFKNVLWWIVPWIMNNKKTN